VRYIDIIIYQKLIYMSNLTCLSCLHLKISVLVEAIPFVLNLVVSPFIPVPIPTAIHSRNVLGRSRRGLAILPAIVPMLNKAKQNIHGIYSLRFR